MRPDQNKYLFIWLMTMLLVAPHCKKPYLPSTISVGNNFLVVDGIINTGSNGVSSINLSRTRNLGDTVIAGIPELNAHVSILSSTGTAYPLNDTAGNALYTSAPLNLNTAQTYRIDITTSDNKRYQSDLVQCKQTPPIDSFYWEQPHDLSFYLNTHDPANSTIYYRWDYTETWQHDANYKTVWYVKDNLILVADSNTQTTNCWTTRHSSDILLGSSQTLSQDVIDRYNILTIPNGDTRVDNKYSILVREYALTPAAYAYWQIIQKTSQNLGSLFDLQPTQLKGNIHCLSNPAEPVIGFTSASSVQENRIFLYQTNLVGWMHQSLTYGCDTIGIPVNQSDYRIYVYPDSNFSPYYFITGGPLILASRICLDCRLQGGNNKRPSYWK